MATMPGKKTNYPMYNSYCCVCCEHQENFHYEFLMHRMTKEMEMKANEAYGPVSSSQPPPPPASEGAYDL